MQLTHPKILTWAQATKQVKLWQDIDEAVVFTNGCFDILHAGHVDLLDRAKALGKRLVIGLNSDSSIRRLGKGPERPINKENERAFVLAHLACVDMVVVFEEDTPLELIKTLSPDILVKGGDWTVDKIVGAKEIQDKGGKVFSLPLLGDLSTTKVVQMLKKQS